ncbi:hypothetical protein IFU23_23955 [Pantoea agglomerans]|uniref:hypothetical protein n=1 Tax=Enterobacter agglomerans TaxID=549 RepID=UPI001780DD9E|nr:hypothetical protein [Pantoea agglomerans]MBD8155774.1 hypothetical protein [Pantoea agglomerans]MBD8161141.1 hypothetical protein [Pantoea agglomerans]
MEKDLSLKKPSKYNNYRYHNVKNLKNSFSVSQRVHCVSVRLNNSELNKLNMLRGDISKGQWLRNASLQKLSTTVPPINISTWKTLCEINKKLITIALHIDSKNADSKLTHTELFAVRRQIIKLRQNLLNADIWSNPYEGHAEDQTR